MEIVIRQLASIVGEDYVITDSESLKEYSDGNITFIPPRTPLVAVRPCNNEEIREILKVAALNKIPVTPSSSTRAGHGGSIPSVPGITIDLRRMNKIELIDPSCRNAIIEPGVTFLQLQESAKKHNLRVLTPVEITGDSSVLSTYLDMVPLYSWPRYGTESVLTMEAMIPNGEIIRTGIAAIPLIDKPYFPFGTNPSYLNKIWFGSQGTFGIATKGVIKLKTLHKNIKVLYIPFKTFEESFPVIKELKRFGYAIEFFMANPAYLAGLIAENEKELSEISEKLPPVTAVLILRGEEEEIEYQYLDILDLTKQFNIECLEEIDGINNVSSRILEEIENPKGYERRKSFKGGYAVIPFICMLPQIPLFKRILGQMSQAFKYNPAQIGELFIPVEPARGHFQYSFIYNPENPQELMITKKFFEMFSNALIKMGAFFSRPYGNWAELVYAKAGAYKAMLKNIKEAIDPDNIMNPGKLNL